jgi:hypothetical protein
MPEYGMKYDLVIRPGADPSKAKFQYSGHDDILVNPSGEFVVQTAIGQVTEKKPYIYQEIKGNRIEIEASFVIEGNNLSWRIRDYDRGYALIIDPGLIYSTFLGGTLLDYCEGIAIDTLGNAYITGQTKSLGFPTAAGAYDTTYNGNSDIFITKLNSAGNGLIYSTFLGATLNDIGWGIAIDTLGNAYITGLTYSSNFPTTPGAYDTSFNGGKDAFVTKLNSAGNGLIHSTFLGGTLDDDGRGIAIDTLGNAYITGQTKSLGFPTTAGAYNTSLNGPVDIFITKLNSAGTDLIYSTFLGGTLDDYGFGIAIDTLGNAYITGYTGSSDFPTTAGAYDTSHNGLSDVFITKLNSACTGLIYSTFLGGTLEEYGFGIAIDTLGNAYITGYAYSSDFPTTAGAYDTSHNGLSDVFITKLSSAGNGLIYSTFLGGTLADIGSGIAIDTLGNTYITGYTQSSDFPTTAGAHDTSHNGAFDVFFTKLNSANNELIYSTFLGGTSEDYGQGIAIDTLGNAYITGETKSPGFPTTAGAYDTSLNGDYDVFVLKIQHALWIYSITRNGTEATIQWNALSGKSYIVEWSENMSSWTQVPVGQVGQWTDANAGVYSKKFYRVMEE